MQKMQAKSASKKAGVNVLATINFIICKFATFFLNKYYFLSQLLYILILSIEHDVFK